MTAARTGKLGPVKALLARGAEVDAKERRGQTALMWASAEGHSEVVAALLQAGADFRTPLPSGFTPLFFGVREGRMNVVQVLLKAGADVNEAMQPRRASGRAPGRGTSPLIVAVEKARYHISRLATWFSIAERNKDDFVTVEDLSIPATVLADKCPALIGGWQVVRRVECHPQRGNV